ncbi:M3 family metallopeptidase [Methylophilaceae bacterium]|nr:M3 family metallopeptidase [Methylophilaceae bacterium]
MSNPLLNRVGLPLFEQIKVDHVSPALNKVLKENKNVIKKIESDNQEPSWQNFVSPLQQSNEKLSRVWSQVNHLNAVVNNEELRIIYNKNLTKVTKYYSELSQNALIYKKFKKIRAGKIYTKLTTPQKKIISDEILGFELGGVGLNPLKKVEFKKILSKLSKLSSSFEENLLDSVNNYSLLVSDKSKLKGIPKNILVKARVDAKKQNKNGWSFSLDFPCYLPVVQYADNRELREEIYYAYATKASDLGDKNVDNTNNINNILMHKKRLSNLLGFSNYASMALTTKMANSSKEVINFLENLSKKAKPFANKDMEDLKIFGKKVGIKNIEAWDIAYLSEKIKEDRFNYSEQEIKNYFPDYKVIEGLFKVVESIYGICIHKEITEIWHKDVTFYKIKNKSNKIIGYFYLDLYARKNKRGGAWMDEAISKFKFPNEQTYPVAYLTCNFTAPVNNNSSLLTHDEVITLFHEFGHGLHHLLTEINDYGVSGIQGVEWDAVELPSQFMENFCWEWSVIKNMTEHIESKKTMPKLLFNKLLKSKNFQSGMQTTRQVEFALFDIMLHSTYNPISKNFLTLLNQVRDQVAVVSPPSWNRFPHSFSHIFAGGYAAGYYSYKWAEVLSADAYSLFEEIGILSAEAGDKFRKEILAKGGSRPAIESFIKFRGRKPSIDALLKHHGLLV